jgi:formamidopyrimidine-DNA glycosylase
VPELPDVTVYCERLSALFGEKRLLGLRIGTPFVLRTYDPPKDEFVGKRLLSTRRIGKRICLEFEGNLFCVVHLMIAGRLKMRDPGVALARKLGLASFDFEGKSVLLTEAGTKKRASIHLFRSKKEALSLDRGGLEPLELSAEEFRARLRLENRTLKRALCDPRILSGIGNAYSDEILFWAQLSPVTRTHSLSDEQCDRLYAATIQTLKEWTKRLLDEVGDGFPEKVTAFRDEMAVHGKFKQPCPSCGTEIQRIRYASNETNYCPRCQTGGKLLADRSLSRLLRGDWPKNIDELEELKA